MSHPFYTALSLCAMLLIGRGISVLRKRDYEAASAVAIGLVVVVVVMLTACSAHAEDWWLASSNKQGDIFEIDLDTLAVWQDGSVSVKVETNGTDPIVQNFDCNGHFIVLAPPNNIGVRRVVAHTSMATIESEVCALRDHVLAEKK